MGLRIGYKASAEQFAPTELAAFAVFAEEVGLDSVTISDHFQPWRLTGGHAPNSLAWLGFVAARTERVLLGTSVMTPTFRYNPPVLAQTFATLACLAPSRIFLGVGTGEALNEVAVGSVTEGEWPEFKERFARLREAISLIRDLWTQDSVSFEGVYYRTQDARIFDRPDLPVPVYVAAGGPMVARYAGRVGDGFICTSGKGRELYADQLVPAVAAGRAKSTRPDEPIERMIEIKLSWDPELERARENTRLWAPLSPPWSRSFPSEARPRWRAPRTPCRLSRPRRGGLYRPTRPRSSRRCGSIRISALTTSSFMARGMTRSGSFGRLPNRSCRGCASSRRLVRDQLGHHSRNVVSPLRRPEGTIMTDKAIIVPGAAVGLGRATALCLDADGYRVGGNGGPGEPGLRPCAPQGGCLRPRL